MLRCRGGQRGDRRAWEGQQVVPPISSGGKLGAQAALADLPNIAEIRFRWVFDKTPPRPVKAKFSDWSLRIAQMYVSNAVIEELVRLQLSTSIAGAQIAGAVIGTLYRSWGDFTKHEVISGSLIDITVIDPHLIDVISRAIREAAQEFLPTDPAEVARETIFGAIIMSAPHVARRCWARLFGGSRRSIDDPPEELLTERTIEVWLPNGARFKYARRVRQRVSARTGTRSARKSAARRRRRG